MNGDLIHQETTHLATRIVAAAGNDRTAQVDQAFERILSRPPSTEERTRFSAYGGNLASICRVLLNSNEFLYVE
jgi:hypothetical protein